MLLGHCWPDESGARKREYDPSIASKKSESKLVTEPESELDKAVNACLGSPSPQPNPFGETREVSMNDRRIVRSELPEDDWNERPEHPGAD